MNACVDQSSSGQTATQMKVNAAGSRPPTQSNDVRPVTDPERNLRPERPPNLKTSFEIRLYLCTMETAAIYLTLFVILYIALQRLLHCSILYTQETLNI